LDDPAEYQLPQCSSVPIELGTTCGKTGCHNATDKAQGLDLQSAGLEARLVDKRASECHGLLVDPSRPEESILYKKLGASPPCGAQMPLGGTPYTAEQAECVLAWIGGLGAGGAGGGGGTVVCNGTDEHLESSSKHCYRAVTTAKSWLDAQTDCEKWGGDLVAITSEEEQKFVAAFVAANSWIGDNDQKTEGNFQWTSGEPWSYSNWHSGEPNDSGGNEDCAEIYSADGTWNDALCTNALPYVCER